MNGARVRETRIARVSFFLGEKRIYEMKKREREITNSK